MTKSWNIDNLLPEALETYLSIEKTLNIKILNQIPIRRYFLNINDLDRAKKRIKNPRYSTYINKINSYNEGPSVLKDSYGSIEISKGCWINLPLLLSHLEKFFLSKNLYVESYFDPNRLTKNGTSNRWEYDNLSSKNVIFCQGIHSLRNKYFSSLPIIPIKGEILSLKLSNVNIPNGIYYKKKWLISENDSENNDTYKLGASYQEGNNSNMPTSKGKNDLLEIFDGMLDRPNYQILKHQSGIRPSSIDAIPFICHHGMYSNLYCINGLGSKGTSTAPLLTKELFDYLSTSRSISTKLVYNL